LWCYGTRFKQSHANGEHWYCRGCNELYDFGKPDFPLTLCSKHGITIDQHGIGNDLHCWECEEEAIKPWEDVVVEEENVLG
jgi:Fe2+ or Zn2+ uptake regulation protein